ncbi:MAG: class I SAM-dependent methyltransferase [Rhodoferax sp.]
MPPRDSCGADASPWVQRWSHLVSPGANVLDVACGGGRHLAWFAQRGHPVWGVDIDTAAAQARVPSATLVQADIENGPWPLRTPAGQAQAFGAVLVSNYLWRALWPTLLDSLAEGGVLLYETFTQGQESVGRPRRPEFLLQPGELLQRCAALHIVAFEQGFEDPPGRFVQRIAAVRTTVRQPGAHPPVYPLACP